MKSHASCLDPYNLFKLRLYDGSGLFVYLFVLRLNVPVNNFSVMLGKSQRFLGLTSIEGSFWSFLNCYVHIHISVIILVTIFIQLFM